MESWLYLQNTFSHQNILSIVKTIQLPDFLFFTEDIKGDTAYLPEDEAKHCCAVLRKRVGDSISFVDGRGNYYEGLLEETSKKSATVRILRVHEDFERRDYHVHVAISPTKNADRLEWFVEKATEMGVDEITLLRCQRTERKQQRTDRLERVIVSAMKQCLKAKRPLLNEMTDFSDFIKNADADQRFVAYISGAHTHHLKDLCQKGCRMLVLIGPAGDFSPEEIGAALDAGFLPVSLGNSRLRTETAGLAAVHIMNLANE